MSGTARHAMDKSMGPCWCPLRNRHLAKRGVTGPHGQSPEPRRNRAMGKHPEPDSQSTPPAPKEPSRIGKLKKLVRRKGSTTPPAPPTQGTPPTGAGGETS